MSHEPDPRSLDVGRVSEFGARPQPLQSVMNPWEIPCGYCSHALIEKDCPQHGSGGDYVFFGGAHYHRQCLTRQLAEYTAKLAEQAEDVE